MMYRCLPVLLVCVVSLVGPASLGASESRIWVDVQGRFSVEARVTDLDADRVTLKRRDGGIVSVAIDQLSDEDKAYLDDFRARLAAANNPLRGRPPQQPDFDPLPVLDLPPAERPLPDGAPIEQTAARSMPTATRLPATLPPDPAPHRLAIGKAQIQIFAVDIHDLCSAPLAVTTTTASGTRQTSIAMSICRGTQSAGRQSLNQLVRFDLESQQAFVSLNHSQSIRLLDHHHHSGRSLVLVGHDSLGHGGQLAIATGWGPSGVTLHPSRAIGQSNQDVRVEMPELKWARLIDDEHFIAVIDDSIGLWNLVSGRQLYRYSGIEQRTVPAISGGRRYLAIPRQDGVLLLRSDTGESIGRIESQAYPGIAFSPHSDRLAISSSRRIQCWDLDQAAMGDEIVTRPILGTKHPVWIDSDLILSSSGVLVSLFRGIPLWQYDTSATELSTVGQQLVVFRKQASAELSSGTIPHDGARRAMEWVDTTAPHVDPQTWRPLGNSTWQSGRWHDQNVRLSDAGVLRR